MIKNYWKIAWRNLTRNRVYSFINIFGLALGMAVVLLIGSWIRGELTYNTANPLHDRLAAIIQNSHHGTTVNTWWSTPIPLADHLRKQYSSDFEKVAISSGTSGHILRREGGEPVTGEGMYADPELPDMFSLKMIAGSRSLADPSSMLISSTLARSLFGADGSALNQNLKLDNKDVLKVTGVYEDLPQTVDFKETQFFCSWEYYKRSQPWVVDNQNEWNANSFLLFAQLRPGISMEATGRKIKGALDGHGRKDHPEVLLHPMNRWHLYDEFKNGTNTSGAIRYVWLFGFIGLFILLLACINFMNLSTARSEKRAREVGIRKAVGSLRGQLVRQFLGESILLTTLAMVLAVVLATAALPLFSQLAGKAVVLPWSPVFVGVLVVFTLFVGLLAGSYPAIYLSSFNAVKVLKGSLNAGRMAVLPRKILIVVQFVVSIALIFGTIVVFQQIVYLKNRPTGYNRDGLLTIDIRTEDLQKHYDPLRAELLRTGAVAGVTRTSGTITAGPWQQSGFAWQGKDPNVTPLFEVTFLTPEFGKTIGWQLAQGRDFSREFLTDSSAMILNEAAARYMGLKQPVGSTVNYLYSSRKDNRYRVIGVIHDMVTYSPTEQVKPAIYMLSLGGDANAILVKVNPKMSAAAALPKIADVFRTINPGSPFDYKFISDEYAKEFNTEERVLYLATFFTAFAIFISCLGLFGLASFMAEQRTREIGVRKVLGASVLQLWGLLSKEFLALVGIAFLIALPLSWFGMNSWLQGYDYRTGISIWTFFVVLVGALAITIATVSYQSIRASLINPAKSLRSE